MANVKEIVQDENRANALSNLKNLFEKHYDLTSQAHRQALVEGLAEVGKHAAATCSMAQLSLTFGANGLTGLVLDATPTPV